MDTDGFALFESRAIATYLIQKYKPDSNLYPSDDLKARSSIDKFLHYDLGTFYRAISDVVVCISRLSLVRRVCVNWNINLHIIQFLTIGFSIQYGVFREGKVATEKLPRYDEVMQLFDDYIKSNENGFIAGDQLTVADVSLYFSTTLTELLTELDITKYDNIQAWFLKVEDALKQYNEDGVFDEARANIKMFAQQKLSEGSKQWLFASDSRCANVLMMYNLVYKHKKAEGKYFQKSNFISIPTIYIQTNVISSVVFLFLNSCIWTFEIYFYFI